jgi:hypothetical protein
VREQERVPLGQKPHRRGGLRRGPRRAPKVEELATLLVAKPKQLLVQRLEAGSDVRDAQSGELDEILPRGWPESAEVALDEERSGLGRRRRRDIQPALRRREPHTRLAPRAGGRDVDERHDAARTERATGELRRGGGGVRIRERSVLRQPLDPRGHVLHGEALTEELLAPPVVSQRGERRMARG